jgi:hypothetical protein
VRELGEFWYRAKGDPKRIKKNTFLLHSAVFSQAVQCTASDTGMRYGAAIARSLSLVRPPSSIILGTRGLEAHECLSPLLESHQPVAACQRAVSQRFHDVRTHPSLGDEPGVYIYIYILGVSHRLEKVVCYTHGIRRASGGRRASQGGLCAYISLTCHRARLGGEREVLPLAHCLELRRG